MSKPFAICTFCFGDRYIQQQIRLVESLRKTNPDAELFIWTNEYPPESPTFEQSLYGFKVYAVNYAGRMGYKRIVWIDTACIVHEPLDYLFNLAPVVAVKDDTPLARTISDKALAYCKNPDITGLNLVGGSLYSFNFEDPLCHKAFNTWSIFERNGMFGTMEQQVSEQINKHRHDESMMAMALHLNKLSPVTPAQARYCSGLTPAVTKKHFK